MGGGDDLLRAAARALLARAGAAHRARRCAAGSSCAACSSTRRWRRSSRDGEELGLTLLQLHGDEGPSFCAEVARRTGARVIKAAQVSGPGDVRDLERFHVDFHLLDARAKRAERRAAARRHRGDVRLGAAARRAARKVPLILSGGLDAGNVGRGDRRRPARTRVDSASGTESAPGHKDPERLRGASSRAGARRPTERAAAAVGAAGVSATVERAPPSSTASAPTAGSSCPRR